MLHEVMIHSGDATYRHLIKTKVISFHFFWNNTINFICSEFGEFFLDFPKILEKIFWEFFNGMVIYEYYNTHEREKKQHRRK